MPDTGDNETPESGASGHRSPAPRPRLVWRLLRLTGWLVFYLVVAFVSYILLVLAGH
jgi:hypothetical protein